MSISSQPLDFLSDQAEALLKEHRIALSLEEAQDLQRKVGRPLTLAEATILGIQLSEHCSYKSSRPHLKGLPTTGDTVVLGPAEDAGVLEVFAHDNEKYCIAVGHESHNSPSRIVPFEGAATGVGGIVRDIMCMGARPVGVLDSLRLGDLNNAEQRNIASGVVSGIAGYGNPLGVPNVGGDVYFSEAFNGNCLVNVTALGALRESDLIHSYVPKEAAEEKWELIIVGKPTDNSGFGGASFSSEGFSEDDDMEFKKAAVQEPNPFLERHLLASIMDLIDTLKASDELHKIACKDLGAGGVLCATVELAEGGGYGADVQLDQLHVAKDDFLPHVIACSETQERFCFACHPSLTARIIDHFETKWELGKVAAKAGASKVGTVRADGQYRVTFKDELLCDAPAELITEGIVYDRPYEVLTTPNKAAAVKYEAGNVVIG